MSAAIHQDSTLSSPRISPFDGLSPASGTGRRRCGRGRRPAPSTTGCETNLNSPLLSLRRGRTTLTPWPSSFTNLSAQALVHLRALLDHPDTPPLVRLKTCLAILERVGYPTTGGDLPQDQDNAVETSTGALPDPADEPATARNAPPRLSALSSLTVPPN